MKSGEQAFTNAKLWKVIVVKQCKMCPKLDIQWNDKIRRSDYACKLEERKIHNKNEMPKWCPLEDYL